MHWPVTVRGSSGAAVSVVTVSETFVDLVAILHPAAEVRYRRASPSVYRAALSVKRLVSTGATTACELLPDIVRSVSIPTDGLATTAARVEGLAPDTAYVVEVRFTAQDGDARGIGSLRAAFIVHTLPCVVPHRLCHVGQDFAKLNFVRPQPQAIDGAARGLPVLAAASLDCGPLEVELRTVVAASEEPRQPYDPPPPLRRCLYRRVRFTPPVVVPWIPEDGSALSLDLLPHSTAFSVRVRSVQLADDGAEKFGPFSGEVFIETLVPERLAIQGIEDRTVTLRLAQRLNAGAELRLAEQAPVLPRYRNSSDGIRQRRAILTASWDQNTDIRDTLAKRRDELVAALDVLRVAAGGDAANAAIHAAERSRPPTGRAAVLNPTELAVTEAAASAESRRRAEVAFIVAAYERRIARLDTALERAHFRRYEVEVPTEGTTQIADVCAARYAVVYEVLEPHGWRTLTELSADVDAPAGATLEERIPELGAVAEDPGEHDVGFMKALLGTNVARAGIVRNVGRESLSVAWSAVDHVEAASLVRAAQSASDDEAASALDRLDDMARAKSTAEGVSERGIQCEFLVCVVEHPNEENLEAAADALLNTTLPTEGREAFEAAVAAATATSEGTAPPKGLAGVRRVTEAVRGLGRVMRIFVRGDATSGMEALRSLPQQPTRSAPDFEVPLQIGESRVVNGRGQLLRVVSEKHALQLTGLSPGRTYTLVASQYCALTQTFHTCSRPVTATTETAPTVVAAGFPPPDGMLFSTTVKLQPPPQALAELRHGAERRGVHAIEHFGVEDAGDLTLPDAATCFCTSKAIEFVITPGVHAQPGAELMGGAGSKSRASMASASRASMASKKSVATRRTLAASSFARQSVASSAFSGADALQAEVLRFSIADAIAGVALPHFNNPGAVSIHARFVDEGKSEDDVTSLGQTRSDGRPAGMSFTIASTASVSTAGPTSPGMPYWSSPVYVVLRALPVKIKGMTGTNVDVSVAWPGVSSLDEATEPYHCVLQELYSTRLCVVLGDNADSPSVDEVTADVCDFSIGFQNEDRVIVKANLMQAFGSNGVAARVDATKDWVDSQANVSVQRLAVITPVEVTDSCLDFALTFQKRAPSGTEESVIVGPEMSQIVQRAFARELRKAVEVANREKRARNRRGSKWRRDARPSGTDVEVELVDHGPDTPCDRPPAPLAKAQHDDRSASATPPPEPEVFRLRSPALITRIAGLRSQRVYQLRARPLLFSSSEGDSFGPWSAAVLFRTAPQIQLSLDAVDEWSVRVAWRRGNPLRWDTPRLKEVLDTTAREVTSTSFGSATDEYLAFVYRSVIRGAHEALLESPMWGDASAVGSPGSTLLATASSSQAMFAASARNNGVSVSELVGPDETRAVFAGLEPDEPFVVKVRQITHPANELSSHYGPSAVDTIGQEVETDHLSWCARGLVVRTAPLLGLRVALGREGAAGIVVERRPPSSTAEKDLATITDRDGCELVAAGSTGKIIVHALQLRFAEGDTPEGISPLLDSAPDPRRSPHLIPGATDGNSPIKGAAKDGSVELPVPRLHATCDGTAYWDAARAELLDADVNTAMLLPADIEFDHHDPRLWWNAPPEDARIPVHGSAFVLHGVLPCPDGSRLVNFAPEAMPFTVQALGLGAGRHFGVQMRYTTSDAAPASPWHEWLPFATRAALHLRALVVREHSAEVAWQATQHDDDEEPVMAFEVEVCGLLLRDRLSRGVGDAADLASDGRGRLYSPLARTLVISAEHSRCTLSGLLSGRVYGVAVRAKLATGIYGPTSRFLFMRTLPPLVVSPIAALERTMLLGVSRATLEHDVRQALTSWLQLVLRCELEAMYALRHMDDAELEMLLQEATVHTAAFPTERYDVRVRRTNSTAARGVKREIDDAGVVSLPMGARHFLLRNLDPDTEYSVSARTVQCTFPSVSDSHRNSMQEDRQSSSTSDARDEESAELLEERSNWSRPATVPTAPAVVLDIAHTTATAVAAALRLPSSTGRMRSAASDAVARMVTSGTYRVTIAGIGHTVGAAVDANQEDGATVLTLDVAVGNDTKLVINGLRDSCRYQVIYAPLLPESALATVPDLSAAEARAAREGERARTLRVVHTAPHQPPPPQLYEATATHVSWMWDFEAARAEGFNLLVRKAAFKRTAGDGTIVPAALTRAYTGTANAQVDAAVEGILREGRCDVVVPAEALPSDAEEAAAFDARYPRLSAGLTTPHLPYALKGVFFVVECAAAALAPDAASGDDDAPGGELLHGTFLEVGRADAPFMRLRVNPRDNATALDVLRSSLVRVKAAVPVAPGRVLESGWSPAVRGAALLPLGPPLHVAVEKVEGATARVSWTWPHDVAAHNQVVMEVQLHREAFGEYETALRVRYPATTAELERLCLRESYRLRCRATSTFGAGEFSKATKFATSSQLASGGAHFTRGRKETPAPSIHDLWGQPGDSTGESGAGAAAAAASDAHYVVSPLEAQFPFAGFKDFDATPPPCDTPFHSESGRFAASLAAAAEGVLPVLARLGRAREDIPLADGCVLPTPAVRNPRPPRRAILAARSAARRNVSVTRKDASREEPAMLEPAPPRIPRRGSV